LVSSQDVVLHPAQEFYSATIRASNLLIFQVFPSLFSGLDGFKYPINGLYSLPFLVFLNEHGVVKELNRLIDVRIEFLVFSSIGKAGEIG